MRIGVAPGEHAWTHVVEADDAWAERRHGQAVTAFFFFILDSGQVGARPLLPVQRPTRPACLANSSAGRSCLGRNPCTLSWQARGGPVLFPWPLRFPVLTGAHGRRPTTDGRQPAMASNAKAMDGTARGLSIDKRPGNVRPPEGRGGRGAAAGEEPRRARRGAAVLGPGRLSVMPASGLLRAWVAAARLFPRRARQSGSHTARRRWHRTRMGWACGPRLAPRLWWCRPVARPRLAADANNFFRRRPPQTRRRRASCRYGPCAYRRPRQTGRPVPRPAAPSACRTPRRSVPTCWRARAGECAAQQAARLSQSCWNLYSWGLYLLPSQVLSYLRPLPPHC